MCHPWENCEKSPRACCVVRNPHWDAWHRVGTQEQAALSGFATEVTQNSTGFLDLCAWCKLLWERVFFRVWSSKWTSLWLFLRPCLWICNWLWAAGQWRTPLICPLAMYQPLSSTVGRQSTASHPRRVSACHFSPPNCPYSRNLIQASGLILFHKLLHSNVFSSGCS